MHETDMTRALIVTIRQWWQEQPGNLKIQTVHLTVGKFTCVEPASLQFAFEVQTQNTFLEGSRLAIQETPLLAFCHSCQQDYFPDIGLHYSCPQCHRPMEDIRSGRELKIDRIEYEEVTKTVNFC
jgi:hydrogenase nickel incorporation protein HypA/HybF